MTMNNIMTVHTHTQLFHHWRLSEPGSKHRAVHIRLRPRQVENPLHLLGGASAGGRGFRSLLPVDPLLLTAHPSHGQGGGLQSHVLHQTDVEGGSVLLLLLCCCCI